MRVSWGAQMTKGPDLFLIQANLLIISLTLCVMIGLFAFAAGQKGSNNLDAILFKKLPSTASAFWFFFASYACLFFLYTWLYIYIKAGRELSAPEFEIGTDILGNTSNLCFLMTGVAYCRGRNFNILSAAGMVVLLAFLITIWAFGWTILGGNSLFVRSRSEEHTSEL